MNRKEKIFELWEQLYPEIPQQRIESYLEQLVVQTHSDEATDWYKDAVVYSLYVDLYAGNFAGLMDRLDYLQKLGVSCLWLLPILDSPMRDAGFDIRTYDLIRHDLLGLEPNFTKEEQEKHFGLFLSEAHRRGIRVIFDIAINHCSEEHFWFQEARKSDDNPYRNYFIWTKDPGKYNNSRIIFKGMETSNWEPLGDSYYFHRFFNFQPDLNYRNPEVLLAMVDNFLYWQKLGVDGFRADAIPYLWKEEGTDCENLPQTHLIVKLFRAILDFVKPGTLLLAEACQKPAVVVEYMGEGDECHAAYHFPVMPMFYKSIAMQSNLPIREILNPAVSPKIPENSQWFTFLRCHDELSLELVYVSENDRKYIHQNYCHEKAWDFRLGEGISARLANLFQFDEHKIGLAYSIMLSLPGTPVIYYGDELGKENDMAYYNEMKEFAGKDDTRFLVRGRMNWQEIGQKLANPASFQSKVYQRLKTMLNIRNKMKAFGRGELNFVEAYNIDNQINMHILAYKRSYKNEKILVVQNLSDAKQKVRIGAYNANAVDLLSGDKFGLEKLLLEPYQYFWFQIE